MNPILVVLLALLPLLEPPARKLTVAPLRVEPPFAHVSAVRELRDGRLIVTDAAAPAIFILTPATGKSVQMGSVGAAPGQYVRPGGLYAGPHDSIFVIDRAQTRLLVVSPAGVLGESRSIALKGTTSSSDGADLQRLDARGLVYYIDRRGSLADRLGGSASDSTLIIRLDAATQKRDTVARLRKGEEKVTQVDEHTTFSKAVVGSPADGWAVAPDGRVAAVRAAPYRVDWFGARGNVVHGPVITYDVLPMTEADRNAYTAHAGRGVSAGMSGGPTVNSSDLASSFAPNKPPFEPSDVTVDLNGRVWVRRTGPFAASGAVYDVFDDTGARVDRIELPANGHIVGFGAAAVYVAEQDSPTQVMLKKYKL